MVRGASTERIEPILQRDPDVAFYWGVPVECASVLIAAQRQQRIAAADYQKARNVLDHLRHLAFEVQPTEVVRSRALRLLSVHVLSAATALELAAALIWCREQTQGASLVSLHEPLRLAASLEGFRVLPYAEEVHEPELP